MTYKEAIERIKEGVPFSALYVPEWEEAKQKAIKAIEKQIPKKPNIERQDICFAFRCPDCNQLFINKYNDEFIIGEKVEFCYECGQHIDWSDEK